MSTQPTLKAPRKLIEVALPLDDINAAASKEKSIRHGHPSTLHLWWARRPLAAARAVIFSQLVNDPSWRWEFEHPNEEPTRHHIASWAKQRKRLFGILRKLVLWENTNNDVVLNEAREEIRKSWRETCAINREHPQAAELFNPDKLPGLHDPFAGGGTIPLEAQRLGLDAYASDLNPVAVLINKAMIEIPPRFAKRPPIGPIAQAKDKTNKSGELFNENNKGKGTKKNKKGDTKDDTWEGASGLAEDVRRYGAWMREQAFSRIGHLYPTLHITPEMVKARPDLEAYKEQSLTVIAWLWARTVKSPNPAFRHVDVPLVSSFVLSKKDGKDAYIQPVIQGDSYHFTVQIGTPPPDAENGTSAGKRQAFRCIFSDTPIDYNYIRSEGQAGRMGARMMAIVAEGKSSRHIPRSHPRDGGPRRQQANPTWKPNLPQPNNTRDFKTPNYGLENFGDLFTPRQLVALNTFSELIAKAREQCRLDYLRAKNPHTPPEEMPPTSPDDEIPLEQGGNGATAYADAIAVYLWQLMRLATWSSLLLGSPSVIQPATQFGRQSLPMTWDLAERILLADSERLSGAGGMMESLDSVSVKEIFSAVVYKKKPKPKPSQQTCSYRLTRPITTTSVTPISPTFSMCGCGAPCAMCFRHCLQRWQSPKKRSWWPVRIVTAEKTRQKPSFWRG